MIPRPQHFGDRAPFPLNRPGIVRIFKKPRLEALFLSAGGRAHYPGEQSDASIEDHHRAELAAGEHVVADRHLFDGTRLENSLVESFKAPAEKDHALPARHFADASLSQRCAS